MIRRCCPLRLYRENRLGRAGQYTNTRHPDICVYLVHQRPNTESSPTTTTTTEPIVPDEDHSNVFRYCIWIPGSSRSSCGFATHRRLFSLVIIGLCWVWHCVVHRTGPHHRLPSTLRDSGSTRFVVPRATADALFLAVIKIPFPTLQARQRSHHLLNLSVRSSCHCTRICVDCRLVCSPHRRTPCVWPVRHPRS
jgi:hypothetical protein